MNRFTLTLFVSISVFLQLTASNLPKFSHLNSSVLTIVTQDPGSCGKVNDTTRDVADVKDLVEVMDNTNAYDLGTGFVVNYKNSLYIISCEHVLYKAGKIAGYDSEYNRYPLEIVGTDMFYDLAVLKFSSTKDEAKFKGLSFSNCNSNTNKVWGIGYWKWNGNANIEDGSIMHHTKSEDTPFAEMGYLKSNTKIAGGFSGGPLLDRDGNVIGMNTCINKRNNSSYALEASILEKQVHSIIENKGHLKRVYCGLRLSQDPKNGLVIVDDVLEDSPADPFKKNLLMQNIDRINSQQVYNVYDALRIIEQMQPGEKIFIELNNNKHVVFQTGRLSDKSLENIAVHAVSKSYEYACHNEQACPEVKIDQGNVVISENGKKDIIRTAGIEEDRIYCLENSGHLGILIRLYGLHGYIELGKDDAHIYIKPISFATEKFKRFLYY